MELIVVYNAQSALHKRVFDTAHKIVSPSTYNCELCLLTHNAFNEAKAWRNFKNRRGIQCEIFHKDDFEKNSSNRYNYPVILTKDVKGNYQVVLNKAQIANFETVESLIDQLANYIHDS